MLLIFAILLIIILVVLVRCIVIVPQSNAYVTEWLGVYKDTWGAGLHIRTPFVERISRKVSLKEEAADFPPAARHHPRQRHHDDRHCRFLPGV